MQAKTSGLTHLPPNPPYRSCFAQPRPTRRVSWGAGGAIFAQVLISSKSVQSEYLHDENDRACFFQDRRRFILRENKRLRWGLGSSFEGSREGAIQIANDDNEMGAFQTFMSFCVIDTNSD